jgi:hypothetical protein
VPIDERRRRRRHRRARSVESCRFSIVTVDAADLVDTVA